MNTHNRAERKSVECDRCAMMARVIATYNGYLLLACPVCGEYWWPKAPPTKGQR